MFNNHVWLHTFHQVQPQFQNNWDAVENLCEIQCNDLQQKTEKYDV